MLNWSAAPSLRLSSALILGIVGYLYLGQAWGGSAAPWAVGAAGLFGLLWYYSQRQRSLDATQAAGLLGLLAVAALGFARVQAVTQSRWPDALGQLVPRIEYYRAVVDEAPVVRPATFATTLRVQAVRVAGRWQRATGGIRVSLPRHETAAPVLAPATATCGWCAAPPSPPAARPTPGSSTTAATWLTIKCIRPSTCTRGSTGWWATRRRTGW